MNRTSWPVLRRALIIALAAFSISTVRADEQLTVVQQTTESKPPFVIQIQTNEKAMVGKTKLRVLALDQVHRSEKYTKALSLSLFLTDEKGETTQHELNFKRGVAEMELDLQAGSYIGAVLNSNQQGRAYASTAIKVVQAIEVLR